MQMSRLALALAISVTSCAAWSAAEFDDAPSTLSDDGATPSNTGLHLQLTNVTQRHPRFNSPYSGTNSLGAVGRSDETTDITAYLGVRLWRGGELWVNPEVDQGFGFNKTVGVAGFPSGEAYKIGAYTPYLRVPRLFIRQTIALGGSSQATEASPNQLAGSTTTNNLVVTVGKFAVVDVFDTNRYAHDPRADFLNWSVIDAGTFDYAADAWGFTYGAAAEWNAGAWTARAGLFQLSRVPNGKIVAADFSQYSFIAELEHRHQWFGGDGKLKVLAFDNRGKMGSYADAVALAQQTGNPPDTSLVRRKSSRSGIALNFEQTLHDGVGFFGRAGYNDGSKEAYEFTEINRSAMAGLAFDGKLWGRSDDTFGVAAVVNQLSRPARAFFAAGGTGILIGDGRLDYGNEKIVESYYSARLNSFAKLSFDCQRIVDPAYNRDRGPVMVYSLRLHLED
jgi:high affinity Mn2+ porin